MTFTVGPVAPGIDDASERLQRLSLRPPAWTVAAACSSPDVEAKWWHSSNLREQAMARVLCAVCPVRLTCAVEALERAEPHGMFGGLTPADRRAVAREYGYEQPASARHGTRSRYVAGCRCPDCRRSHAVYEHERRLRVVRAAERARADVEAQRRRRAAGAAARRAAQRDRRVARLDAESAARRNQTDVRPPAEHPWRRSQRAPIVAAPVPPATDVLTGGADVPAELPADRRALSLRPTRRRRRRHHPMQLFAVL